MARYIVTLRTPADREKAAKILAAAPDESRVEFKGSKRSLGQNDKMWAMLTDVATQLKWHGFRLRPEDWKLLFIDAMRREVKVVPNLAEDGFLRLATSSSDLSKQEMSDLFELMYAFGIKNGVKFSGPDDES